MPRPLTLVACATFALACGPAQKTDTTQRDLSQFQCNERFVEYLVVGGFVADEAGVIVQCSDENPRLTKWYTGADNNRVESNHQLSGEQFDSLWGKIDSTGWRFLEDECENPGSVDGDPVYQVGIADHATQRDLTCTGKELPFPYDRLINELDLRAAGLGDADEAAR